MHLYGVLYLHNIYIYLYLVEYFLQIQLLEVVQYALDKEFLLWK